jgi:single-strand DNA-binding protein
VLPRIAFEARVAQDPELRFGQSGTAICRLRLVAADRRRNQQTNEWEDAGTLWIDGTCFKDTAEHAAESLVKGDNVLVQGKLQTEEWSDRETGDKRSKIALIIDEIGPSLRFRTLHHGTGQDQQRQRTGQPSSQDPWGGSGADDQPPF